MDVAEFLRAVITTDAGNFCLAHRHGGSWSEQFMRWPEDLDRIVNQSAQMRAHGDVYFSSHLFAEPNSHKKYVLPTRTIQADLDHADVATLSVLPTVITETSPGRHQAFWVTQTALDIPALEAVSRRIAYGVPDCDRTGWPAGKKVRLPDTYNYKREKEHLVEIVGVSLRELRLELFNAFPEITVSKEAAEKDVAWVDNEPDPLDVDSLELLRDVKQVIPPRVFSQYTKPANDRSAALWAFVTETLKAGCTREQVFWLARLNANNKFANRPNGDVDLRKDILRADAYLETRQVDIKAMLMDMRHKGNTHQAERFTKISEVVLNYMREQGEFVHTRGGSLYYLRSNTGRPMYISAHSEWMASYLNNVFGLNPTESVTKFVVSYLSSYCRGIPQAGELRALSHYDSITQKLMLHFGGRDVLHVASDSIDVQPNGYAGHVFYYNSIAEPITLGAALDVPWYEFMFGNAVNNLINLSRDEALAILASWTLFVLFRNQATTRPLLALLGAPGCIAGSTVLEFSRGSKHIHRVSVADAYVKMRGYIPRRSWDTSLPTRLYSLKDGVIQNRNIRQIVFSGRKKTYIVTVAGCASFRVTSEHRFLTMAGYKPLNELSVGHDIVVRGQHFTGAGKVQATRAVVQALYHPHAHVKTVGSYGPYGNILRCRAVIEADLNGMSTEDFVFAVNNDEAAANRFIYLPSDVHIHHEDGNPSNDALCNLVYMSKLEHDTLHGYDNVRNLGAFSGMYEAATAAITSIVEYGEEDTYDIEMEDQEAPNFLINDVVVHNSGKTTIAKKVYRLIYGEYKSIGAITNSDNFDVAVSQNALVVYDNVDTWHPWLADSLAASTSDTDIEKRKLYTDADVVTLKRQAVVVLTAHNPRFTREDVVDRLLMLTFSRIAEFESESRILALISSNRDRIWASIVQDIQKVLATPRPKSEEAPQFRMEDFAQLGLWFARALGLETHFVSAMRRLSAGQRSFNLEHDALLVNAITRMLEKQSDHEYQRIDVLHAILASCASDTKMFLTTYKLPQSLSRKLIVMQDSLKQIFDVDWRFDDNQITKLWRFAPRPIA